MVRAGEDLGKRQQRVRYWAALALLRCVMSSPAAAVAALDNRQDKLGPEEEDTDFRPFIYESAEDQTVGNPRQCSGAWSHRHRNADPLHRHG